MNMRLAVCIALILMGTFISSVAQVMLKKAAIRKYPSLIKEYLNPIVIVAYIIFFGATFLSIYAYKEVPLSMGPILEASSYIYVTIFGVTVFKEDIDKKRIVALLLILIGIMIYAFG